MSKAQPATCFAQARFTVPTRGRGLVEISDPLREALADSGLRQGVAQVFTHHTSCSLLLCENADPTVQADLERFLARLVTDGDPLFRHDAEGPDDMPAHVRSVLTGASLSIPVSDGRLALGTWQGAFLYEHRTQPHQRRVTVTCIGVGGQ
ncbi:MAG TPA: secondary thiamine-phosphate synthase enzyme YjbQ [Rhodanobacteraceae bacterium]|nr:secondary thiamine-phosphate synthase enzyme YjbQ [Rhodanobacteraceae bacterium]